LEELAQQRGIPIEKTSTERVGLPGDIEYALFKIGVEALNNIAKHADCALTAISLSKDVDTYTFQICDHGPGFDVEEIKREDKILGLNSMQRLAALIDATLKIDARDQEGTVVEVHGKIKPKGGEE
jgi:signal transduction histidine kinase